MSLLPSSGKGNGSDRKGSDSRGPGVKRPKDIELMQYFDNELDEPRRSEVAAFLVHSDGKDATDKLASLARAGDVIREHAQASAADFDIASAIMAKIESGDLSSDVADSDDVPVQRDVPQRDVPVQRDVTHAKAPAKPAANDNSRRIFGLAALAAVAAAVLLWWGSSGVEVDSVARKPQKTEAKDVDPAPSGIATALPAERVADLEPVDREGPGVEVAAVDFGTSNGSVFYVPNDDDANGQTTVVWLASADGDNADGEK